MNQKFTKNAYALQQLLVLREKLPLRYAGALATAVFNDFDEQVHEGFLLWMDGELPEDFRCGEHSLADIIRNTGASQAEALCMLNTFLQHPEHQADVKWLQLKEGRHGRK